MTALVDRSAVADPLS